MEVRELHAKADGASAERKDMTIVYKHAAAVGAFIVLGGMLLGCQAVPPVVAPNADAMQARRQAALTAADWKQMSTVTIEMLDYGYRPRELRLRVGQPYRLTLVNSGSVNHYFTALEFFASVATRKVEVPRQAEVKAEVFTSFELWGRGGTLDMYFVPLIKGTYRAHCHMKDHLALGIEGVIVVE
jgi:plastocyanin